MIPASQVDWQAPPSTLVESFFRPSDDITMSDGERRALAHWMSQGGGRESFALGLIQWDLMQAIQDPEARLCMLVGEAMLYLDALLARTSWPVEATIYRGIPGLRLAVADIMCTHEYSTWTMDPRVALQEGVLDDGSYTVVRADISRGRSVLFVGGAKAEVLVPRESGCRVAGIETLDNFNGYNLECYDMELTWL